MRAHCRYKRTHRPNAALGETELKAELIARFHEASVYPELEALPQETLAIRRRRLFTVW
jgi:hypothetical protein